MLSPNHKPLRQMIVAALLAVLVVGVFPVVSGASPATPSFQ